MLYTEHFDDMLLALKSHRALVSENCSAAGKDSIKQLQ